LEHNDYILSVFGNNMKKHFTYRHHDYRYLNHAHNYAWLNERTVEVPIIYKLVYGYEDNLLEIGNVLSHYHKYLNIDVVDKYEMEPGVINQDIMLYNPRKKYNLIVSISTMEHIGFDEEQYGGTIQYKQPDKIKDAVDHIRKDLLKEGGLFVFTVPVGYNNALDKDIFHGRLLLDSVYYMHRISADNRWRECNIDEIYHTNYGIPYQFANAIAICSILK